MLAIKLAIRNILRHRRRSMMTMLAIITGVMGIIIFGGFTEANYSGLRESVIRSQYGHMQIYQQGYLEGHRKEPSEYRLSSEEVDKYIEIFEEDERILVASQRVEFAGLLGNETSSQAAIIRGVQPESESLINSALTIFDGDELTDDDLNGVLLGAGLAESLSVEVGDELTLLASNDDGIMNAVDVVVQGKFRSVSTEYDDRAMMMHIEKAQELLGIDSVESIVLLLSDTKLLPDVVESIEQQSATQGLNLEYTTWDKLATFYHKVVKLYDGMFVFINVVIVMIVLISVTNTMMIAVMERTGEIGTIRALGTQRSSVIWQFICEGGVLSFLSALLGILLGVAVASYINSIGIMMSPPPGSSRGFPLRIEFVPMTWFITVSGVVLVALIASYFPARNASRKNIVDALRYV